MTYTHEDFKRSTPPRIMGSETEYTTDAIPFDKQLNRFLPPETYYRENCRDDGVDLWLENGSRLYLDSSLIEYATPEAIGAREVALHEQAGEIIVQQLCLNAAEWMRNHDEENVRGRVYKRSGYSEVEVGDRFKLLEMSAGHHENYLTPITGTAETRTYYDASLSAFLASRSVWAGAGLVTPDGYEFSQKGKSTTFMRAKGKLTAYGQKSAYLLHDDGPFNRLEVRIGDGNMSPKAIERKYAVTSLVLRLIEHGCFPETLQLEADRTDISSRNASRNLPVILRGGTSLSPAMHQKRILEAALAFADTMPDTPHEEVEATLETYEICAMVDGFPHDLTGAETLADTVDWAAKLAAMRSRDIGPIHTGNLDTVAADLKWEDIAKTGLARKWYQQRDQTYNANSAAIMNATLLPPLSRAAARVQVLESLSAHPNDIRWHRIEASGSLYRFDDPYNPTV